MQAININNHELKNILGNFLPALLNVPRTTFPYHQGNTLKLTPEYATGIEYLTHMQSKKVDGFPEQTVGVDLMRFTTPFDIMGRYCCMYTESGFSNYILYKRCPPCRCNG